MIWIFFWGLVTGVGITFVGALFWAAFYHALREGLVEQLNEGKQEKE